MSRMLRTLMLAVLVSLAALPALADDPPAAPTGLETRIQPEIPNKPTYQWVAVDGATGYALTVHDSVGNDVYEDISTAVSACGGSICVVSQAVPLKRGNYTWHVKAHNDAGYGEWSESLSFYVTEFALPIFDPLASPTPIPTASPNQFTTPDIPIDQIYNGLATAEAQLAQLPDDITTGRLPAQDGSQAFGYAKWLLSPSIAGELFGPFSLPVSHIVVIVGLVIFLAVIYFILFVASYVLRFILWVVKTVASAL